MKYENYDRINEIIPDIKAKEKLLDQLNNTGLSVLIKDRKNVIFNIPIGFEHKMSEYGQKVIEAARSIVVDEIAALKTELEIL